MSIEETLPAFAVIGAVNHGKSSVVSTLIEDDAVRVSAIPGETVNEERFSISDLLILYDTPGFQNARKALVEIRSSPADSSHPLVRFREFSEQHRDDPLFAHECRLLRPILAGAGIIYVVDGSRPVTDFHRCEMELVRLTGAPRLAIVNRTGELDHVEDWRAELAQTFNAVREFNAHSASFEDRKDLLEALANIERAWKPKLQEVIDALEQKRDSRILEATTLVVGLVRDCLTYSIRLPLKTENADARKATDQTLQTQFKAEIAKTESRVHDAIIKLFAHRLVKSERDKASLFKDKLFSDETWSLMGLNEKQLVTTGLALRAIVGASTDLFTLGHTLLLGTLIGSAIGGTTAYFVGKKQPEISVSTSRMPKAMQILLPDKFRLATHELVIGPIQAINFPWILLDRAICTLSYVAGRAHARRDQMNILVDQHLPSLALTRLTIEHWSDEDRKRCDKLFATLRKSQTLPDKEIRELTHIIARHLREVVQAADKSLYSTGSAVNSPI